MNLDDATYKGRLRDSEITTHNRTQHVRLTIDVPLAAIGDGRDIDTNFTSTVGIFVPPPKRSQTDNGLQE